MVQTRGGRANTSEEPGQTEQPGSRQPAGPSNKKLPAKPLSRPPRTQPHRAARGSAATTHDAGEVGSTPPPAPTLSLEADQQELSQPLSTLCDVAQAYDDELLEAAGSVVDILREKEAEIRADLRDTLRKLTEREEQRLQRSAAIAACKQARRDKVAEAGGPRRSGRKHGGEEEQQQQQRPSNKKRLPDAAANNNHSSHRSSKRLRSSSRIGAGAEASPAPEQLPPSPLLNNNSPQQLQQLERAAKAISPAPLDSSSDISEDGSCSDNHGSGCSSHHHHATAAAAAAGGGGGGGDDGDGDRVRSSPSCSPGLESCEGENYSSSDPHTDSKLQQQPQQQPVWERARTVSRRKSLGKPCRAA